MWLILEILETHPLFIQKIRLLQIFGSEKKNSPIKLCIQSIKSEINMMCCKLIPGNFTHHA